MGSVGEVVVMNSAPWSPANPSGCAALFDNAVASEQPGGVDYTLSCPPVVVADARVLQSRAIASGGWLAGLHPAWFSSAPRTEDRPALNSQLDACARGSSAVCANVSRETSRPFTTTATTQSKMQPHRAGIVPASA